MLPGPIFNLELLTSARRTRYFVIRGCYALILLVALWFVYQTHQASWRWSQKTDDIHSVAALSAEYFGTFAALQLVAVMILAPAMVAGTIASERERRTIEYLFASQLSNAEIVLGKLAARLLHVVYLVLVGVPVLALMMLLGGIAPEALVVLFVVTLTSLLAVCSLAMAVSVWSARAREAVTRAYLVLFVSLLIPLMLTGFEGYRFYNSFIGPVNKQLVIANPFVTMDKLVALASGSQRGVAFHAVLAVVRNQLIIAAVFAALATFAVRRAHLRKRASSTRSWRRWRLAHWPRPGVGNRPMLWKEVFAESAASRLGTLGRIAVAIIVLAILASTVAAFIRATTSSGTQGVVTASQMYLIFGVQMSTLLACGSLLMVAARAAGSIASERERDCWVSLLSTPLEPKEIIWAKIAGGVCSAKVVVAILLFIWGLAAVLDPMFTTVIPILLGTFLVLAFYASALGVKFSLCCRSSMRAMGATLATGMTVGGLYLFCCIPVMFLPGRSEGAFFVATPCVPFLLTAPASFYAWGEHMGLAAAPMIGAYVLGIIGYLVAAICLAANSISRFDAANGRTGQDSGAIHKRSLGPALVARDHTRPVIPSSSIKVSAEAAVLAEQSDTGNNGV